ncbi:MAG: hypothetical protein ACPGVA_16845 [Pikeienuella sp.]
MIDRRPSTGDWSDDLMEPFHGHSTPAPMVHDSDPVRKTELLDPSGEPLSINIPRCALGFDLRKRPSKG